MKFFGFNKGRLLLGIASACRGLGLGILGRCDKLSMAVQPADMSTLAQFVRPFCIAPRYRKFVTVAPATPESSAAYQGRKIYSEKYLP